MAETDGGACNTLCGRAFVATGLVPCVSWQQAAIAAAGFRVTIAESFRPQIASDVNEIHCKFQNFQAAYSKGTNEAAKSNAVHHNIS